MGWALACHLSSATVSSRASSQAEICIITALSMWLRCWLHSSYHFWPRWSHIQAQNCTWTISAWLLSDGASLACTCVCPLLKCMFIVCWVCSKFMTAQKCQTVEVSKDNRPPIVLLHHRLLQQGQESLGSPPEVTWQNSISKLVLIQFVDKANQLINPY